MWNWFSRLFKHDSSYSTEEFVSSPEECTHESVQVEVDMTMPDFLTETSAEIPVDPIEQGSSEEFNDGRDVVIDKPIYIGGSLLDNRPLVKVFSECADLLSEIERISPRFKSPDSQLLLELVNERLRTALYLSGGTTIEGDTLFDPIRHICPENPMAKEGTAIKATIEAGVSLESRVFIKAKVSLQD